MITTSAIIFLIILILLIALSLTIVRQGYIYTVERFGKYSRSLRPGIHFIIPLIELIGSKVNMMENYLDIPGQNVFSKDNAAIHVDGVLFFRVINEKDAMYNVTNLNETLQVLTMTNIRTVMGSMILDDLLSNRDAINIKLKTVIDEASKPWGIIITRVEIQDMQPPKDLLDAMGRQMKAERDKRANILDAEGFKEAAINKAEGEKQAQILKAEALKASEILKAEAKERSAEAEAYSTKVVSTAIAEGNKEAIQYFVAQQYIDAFKMLAQSNNQKTIFLPFESSQLLGSIASIKELLKSGD